MDAAKSWGVQSNQDQALSSIEDVRKSGGVRSSLQAELTIAAHAEDRALLAPLGDGLKFIAIASAVTVIEGDELVVTVDGAEASHPTIRGRCTSNLFGAGEVRRVA